MSMLRGELWLMIPKTGLRSLENIKQDLGLLDAMEPERRADPNGALSMTDEVEYIMIEDTLNGVTGFFLDDLPDLLRSGKGGVYDFRTGPEQARVDVDGSDVVLTGWDGSDLTAPVEDFLTVLEQLISEYDELSNLLAPAA
ncbi:MAG: hypothetical protein ABJH07_10540 [Sedimentitalea sp.]|uniref:hypothetical protein n=1 Tax=Sedimentitalea sp. TaxID=2048915 RepID=UPI0032636072